MVLEQSSSHSQICLTPKKNHPTSLEPPYDCLPEFRLTGSLVGLLLTPLSIRYGRGYQPNTKVLTSSTEPTTPTKGDNPLPQDKTSGKAAKRPTKRTAARKNLAAIPEEATTSKIIVISTKEHPCPSTTTTATTNTSTTTTTSTMKSSTSSVATCSKSAMAPPKNSNTTATDRATSVRVAPYVKSACQCPNCQEIDEQGPSAAHLKSTVKHCCHFPGCGKQYKDVGHLKAHLAWHNAERLFVCTWPNCNKKYTSKHELQRHTMYTHKVDELFACPLCSKKYRVQVYLTKHMKTHAQNSK